MLTNLLLRLLTAHLLTDFALQPAAWVNDRKEKKIKSISLIWHVALTTLFAYAFSGLYHCWWIPLVIFITHYIIDLVKSYLPDNIYTFLADQAMHVMVIIIIWLIYEQQLTALTTELCQLTINNKFWVLTFGYVLVTWPLGILIGIATTKWRNELTSVESAREGLANAGKWIGICERALILTFVLTSQYTAIGFLMTAKSILRFGDKDKNAEKKTEYILVGTLLSFATSALLGVVLSSAIK
jgi:hypothetical protein